MPKCYKIYYLAIFILWLILTVIFITNNVFKYLPVVELNYLIIGGNIFIFIMAFIPPVMMAMDNWWV
jgi:hypothetical protein